MGKENSPWPFPHHARQLAALGWLKELFQTDSAWRAPGLGGCTGQRGVPCTGPGTGLWQFPPAAFHYLRRWGTVRFCLTVRLERSDLSPSSLPRTLSGTGVHPTFQAPRQRRQERGQSFTFKWSIHYPDLVRVLQTSADLQKSLSFKERFTGPWGAFTGPPPPYSPSVRLDGQAPSCVLCISHPLRHCPLYPHSIPLPTTKRLIITNMDVSSWRQLYSRCLSLGDNYMSDVCVWRSVFKGDARSTHVCLRWGFAYGDI